jgi:hypothetical protein
MKNESSANHQTKKERRGAIGTPGKRKYLKSPKSAPPCHESIIFESVPFVNRFFSSCRGVLLNQAILNGILSTKR